jgi:hypothetical protein
MRRASIGLCNAAKKGGWLSPEALAVAGSGVHSSASKGAAYRQRAGPGPSGVDHFISFSGDWQARFDHLIKWPQRPLAADISKNGQAVGCRYHAIAKHLPLRHFSTAIGGTAPPCAVATYP